MGIFDRLRATSPFPADSKPDTSARDATRLIDEGHALQAQGRLDEAMQCYLDAIRTAPNPARGHLNRGNVLLQHGDLDGALAAFRTALEFQPEYAGAHYNIGNALLGNRQFDKAVASFRSALQINPDYAEVHCSLGVALKELGQLDDAVASFQKALQIDPNLAEAHSNLGNFLGLGQIDAAVASHRRALEIDPNLAEAHINLGNALKELGQFEMAVESYRKALEIKPEQVEAHTNLGIVLQELGLLDAALASYLQALEIRPDYAEAHNSMGNAQQELRQYENALASHRKAVGIKPDYAEALAGLGNDYQYLGQIEEALACYRRALEIDPCLIVAQGNLLMVLNYVAGHTPLHYLEQARQYGRIVAAKVGARFTAWQCEPFPQRLRVGLVSGDLCQHPVGQFLEGLLACIDPARIELIAYPTHHRQDELTARIRPYFSAWNPLTGKNDEAAARLIHADGVHVLLDVSAHTRHNRLPVFAWKPAPVQVSWLGLPTTTGMAEMDYVLGDPHAIPAEYEHHFTEAVWRMPESCLCLTTPTSPVAVVPPPALSTRQVTFGSFNNLNKMTDAVVAVWARILKAVPDSRLLLKTIQLGEPSICIWTRERFAACGIAPERLSLSGTLAAADEHLAAYNKVDIALDTFPYPGVTTSIEALWMGVPVLSLLGDRFISRTAGSIAHNAGLPDWVAADPDDYVAKAVAFAANLEHLAALRAGLRKQVLASPLFDAPRFARNFENAMWGMWNRYQSRQGRLECP